MRYLSIVCAISISLFCGRGIAESVRPSPEGVWLHSNKRIKVEIAPCGERLCGKIVWLKNPNDETGAARSDVNNPDASSRSRLTMGMTVISGLVRTGPDVWSEGTIYNPDDGESYRARVTLVNDDAIEVRAYVLFSMFGETLVWSRSQQ